MMIFLTVLKVIGIILLVILGIVLFVLGLVLFLPVRYRLDADADQRIKKYDGHVNVTWLFHFLHARAWAESGEDGNGIGYEVKVAGIKLMSSEDEVQEEDEELPDYDPVLGDMDLGEEVTVPETTGQDAAEQNVTEKYVAVEKEPEPSEFQDPIDDRVLREFDREHKSFFVKIREIIDKCVSAVRNLS